MTAEARTAWFLRAVACVVALSGFAAAARADEPQRAPAAPAPTADAARAQATPKALTSSPPAAQPGTRAPGRPGSFELMGGAAWLGPASIGSSVANLTANGSSVPYSYFTASGDITAAAAVDARLTFNLTRRLAVEGGMTYSAPSVRVSIGGDEESATAAAPPAERLSQYIFDATVLVFLPKLAFSGGRGRTFVEVGAGYLRQLHEGNFNVEGGQIYNAGAGVKHFFSARQRGFVKGLGWRADVRAYYAHGGYTFNGGGTWTVGLAGAAIVAF